MSNGPHFAICRVEKLKGRAQLASRAQHHLRDGPKLPRNADELRTAANERSWQAGSAALVDAIQARTGPLKRRKDAVDALDVLLTASPNWFREHGGSGEYTDLAAAAEAHLLGTYGADNLMAWGVHLDEQTPHVWAIVTPIIDGKLKASHWCDGPAALGKMQTDWADATAHLGLVRGVAGSPSTHVQIRDLYATINGDPTAAASIEAEMRRRAASATRVEVASKQRAEELEATLKAKADAKQLELEEQHQALIRAASDYRRLHKLVLAGVQQFAELVARYTPRFSLDELSDVQNVLAGLRRETAPPATSAPAKTAGTEVARSSRLLSPNPKP